MNIQFLLLTAKRLLKITTMHRTASVASLLATLVLVMGVGTAMSGAPKMSTPAQTTSSSQSSQQASAPNMQRVKEKIGSESILITRYGFQPAEISRAAGRFFLLVQNRSGANPLALRVSSQGGGTLREFTITSNELDWADEINLPAGQYTVTEANHPDWVCTLMITPTP